MNKRIKELRKTLGLTQQKFADRLGIKQNTVAQYEIGRNEPIDTVVNLIVREFNVNEAWLRTGEGDMFVPVSRDDQITDFMANLLKNEGASFKQRFIAALFKLDEAAWETLEKIVLEVAEDSKKG